MNTRKKFKIERECGILMLCLNPARKLTLRASFNFKFCFKIEEGDFCFNKKLFRENVDSNLMIDAN